MFTLRDEMFDAASDEELGFESKAYRLLRQTMNGYLRYGHTLNLVLIVYLEFSLHKNEKLSIGKTFNEQWSLALNELSVEQTEKFKRYYEQMNYLVFKHIILFSPEVVGLLFAVIFPVYAVVRLSEWGRQVVLYFARAWSSQISYVDTAAFAYGGQS
jgi:hypothetical protein